MEALAEHMAAAGDEVLAFGRRGPRRGEESAARFHPVRPPLTRPARGPRERALGRALIRAAERAGADVTVGVRHLERVDVLWLHGGSHAATMEARYRARHDGRLPEGGLRLRGRHHTFAALEAQALHGGARRVICPSQLVRDELAARYPRSTDRLVVVPNGVDLERFHPREREAARARLRQALRVPERVPLIALPARNPELKGYPALLAALAPLQHLPWQLVLAGPGRPRRWERLAELRGLAGRVLVRSDLPSIDLAAGADLCAIPTWRDTSGLAILEALAAGTPVLTTAQAGAAEAITDARAGRVLESPVARAAWTQELKRVLEAAGPSFDTSGPRGAVLARSQQAWLGSVAEICRAPDRGAV